MTKEQAIKQATQMAVKYAKTGDGEILSKLMRFGYQNDVFVCEDDEYIAVEDNIYYYTF